MDNVGSVAKWTVAGDGDATTIEDVRFAFDYGSFDLFDEPVYTGVTPLAAGLISGGIPEAPRSEAGDAPTTGIFLSANNSSLVPTSLIAGIYANEVSVGAGTANEDYVLRFDAFHSATPGIDGTGASGTTNFQWAGINFTNLPVAPGAVGDYTAPITIGPAGVSGQTLAITGDQSAFDDYEVTIGDVNIEDRNEGFTGLATAHIQRQFEADGFAGGVTEISFANQDESHLTPIPGNESSFDFNDLSTGQQYWRDQFPAISDPLHFDTPEDENPNEFLPGGTPYNRWAMHEVFIVDGVWTYAIDGSLILQVDPLLAGDGSQVVTDSGTFALGFVDAFTSFNASPEGSNFVVYDNIVLDVAAASDVPDILAALDAGGYIPPIPEPGGLGLVALGGLGLVLRRRR
ncbi:MAG: PEP-CTERM sorting domain-containing protein [Planctomycetota bacterium]